MLHLRVIRRVSPSGHAPGVEIRFGEGIAVKTGLLDRRWDPASDYDKANWTKQPPGSTSIQNAVPGFG